MLTYTKDDDRVKVVDKKIQDHTDYLVESINNTKKSLSTKYDNISRDITEAEKVFIGLPEKEKLMNVLNRDFEIFQGSYNFLNNKKIEADIAQAAKTSFHRIITPAHIAKTPVSPNKTIITIVAALMGLFFSIICISIIHAIRARVNDMDTIEKNSFIPIVLTTPFLKSDIDTKNHFLKSVQNLSVKGIITDKKIMCISSYQGKEGKQFHTTHLAVALGLQGRKVLIYDICTVLTGSREYNIAYQTKAKNVDVIYGNLHELSILPTSEIDMQLKKYQKKFSPANKAPLVRQQ
jgi:hypothetical protein